MRIFIFVLVIALVCGLICLAVFLLRNAKMKAGNRAEKQQADDNAAACEIKTKR